MRNALLHLGLGMLLLQVGSSHASAQDQKQGPAERRQALIRQATQGAAAIPALAAALQDNNLVVRRTAVRLLSETGDAARPALVEALENSDTLVRRTAVLALCDPPTEDSLPYLARATKDPDPLLRLAAVNLLVLIKPRPEPVNDLLEEARKDESKAIREVASRAVWPFFRETISIRDRKDWDHQVVISQTIPLPEEGWRLAFDPAEDGHLKNWFAVDFDDAGWDPIKIGQAWEEQGHTYDGVAWYRGSFDLAEKPEHLAVELAFGGVDEVAWVWVNGQYVGQHDLGTAGWDQPFTLDVTKELKWGERNQVTVRVHDSAYAGGIWKPVAIEVLQ